MVEGLRLLLFVWAGPRPWLHVEQRRRLQQLVVEDLRPPAGESGLGVMISDGVPALPSAWMFSPL